MNFKSLLLFILYFSCLIPVSYGCHETGDSNCTAQSKINNSNNSTLSSDHSDDIHIEGNDDNDDGVLINHPYKIKSNINQKKVTLKEINEYNSKKKILTILQTEIDKTKSQSFLNDPKNDYIDKLSFFTISLKNAFKDNNSISEYEKINFFDKIDRLIDRYLNQVEKTMIIKYDFGYFLNDFSLHVKNSFNEISKTIVRDNPNLKYTNEMDKTKQAEKRIDELDYINKLYALLKNPNKQNDKEIENSKNLVSFISELKNELYTKRKKINFIKDNKKNKSNLDNYYPISQTQYEINGLERKIEDLQYVSKVLEIIEKNSP